MRRQHSRIAIFLAGAAVLIPCGAWYWLGTRQLARETEQLQDGARRDAASAAERTAAHLAIRLEELDEHETHRPFVHYFPNYRQWGEGCRTGRAQRSPLARGKKHKLVAAYFQIDPTGYVSSPDAATDVSALTFLDPTADLGSGEGSQRRELKVPFAPQPPPEMMTATPPPCADQPAQVRQFRWQTGAYAGKPALLAIRQVVTEAVTLSQGFLVDGVALLHLPKENGLPFKLVPGEGHGQLEARVPIIGASWHVVVDPSPRLARAGERTRMLRRQFHQSFFAGTFGASLAGVFLVVMLRRSEKLAADRSRFAAAAAHELRTPLAGIRLHGEMLGLSLGNPARVNEYAARITDEAERLTRLVANVFNYTQVDQRRLRLARQRGDLGATVRGALTLVEPIIERAGARLVVTIEDPLPPCELDADAVHQMVRNLVDNAEKYTRGAIDRHIELTVKAETMDGLPVLTLSVRDHGPGVPESERDRIFQPFSRPHPDSTASGLGLGLTVVRTLALAHGGGVKYVAPPTGGANFVVWFPALIDA